MHLFDYLNLFSVYGFFLTLFVIYHMILGPKSSYLKSSYSLILSLLILLSSLYFVLNDISNIEKQTNGLSVLDMRLSYTKDDVIEFASVLNETGRIKYAIFQLGIDSLAPPSFALFISNVICVLHNQIYSIRLLRIVWSYIFVVIMTNCLTPVIMLSYPNIDTPFNQFLLVIIPLFDYLKYKLHALAWIMTIGLYLLRSFYKTKK
jgi:hypothetical protein